jgi:HK97 family phage major capsid protein
LEYKQLVDKLESAVHEMRELATREIEEAKKNMGVATAETKAALEKANADITSLLEQKKAMEARFDDLEVKMQRQSLPGGRSSEKVSDEALAQKSAFYKWIRGGNQVLTPEEKKSLVEDATGQYLIEPELDSEIERALPTITIVRGLASVRTIGKDRIKMRSIGGVSVGWGKLETGTDPTESTLTPGAPTYQYVEDLYGLAKIGEDELMDADVNLESILAEEFARALGEAEEEAFIKGAGHASDEPEGILVNTTLLEAAAKTASAGAVTVEDFMDLIYKVPTQYRRNGVFIVHSNTELAMRKLRAGGSTTGDGPFLWQPAVAEGKPSTFLGRPIYTQDDMYSLSDAAKPIAIFGDVKSGYRIIDRVGMTIQRLTELYSEDGLVGFKIHRRVTGGVMKASHAPLALLTEASGS